MDVHAMWPPIDKDLFRQLILLHNRASIGDAESEKEFDDFVLANKSRFNNPDYLQVFAERIDPLDTDYYRTHFEMCKVFYDFMQNNSDWKKLPFSLRTYIRLGLFEDTFKKFIEENLV